MPKTLLTDLTCKICNHECSRPEVLTKHLKGKHSMTNVEYTIKYLLNDEIPKCKCGCGKDVNVVGYKVNGYFIGHAGGGQWQTKYDKNSDEYKVITAKISKSVSEYALENPREVSQETRDKHSKRMKETMSDEKEKVRRHSKMKETKKKQSEDGTLSANHWTKKLTEEELEIKLKEIGAKSSKTKKENPKPAWNKGLTKETDVRVQKYSESNSKAQTGKISKKRKYSFDPNDWFNKCVTCEKVQIYTNRGSYVNAMRMIAEKGEYKCCTCSADYQCSEKTQKKKDRLSFLNSLTPEQRKEEISKAATAILNERYENVTDEWRQERNEKISKTKLDMDPIRKQEIYAIVSQKNKERMMAEDGSPIFRPGYNKDTIAYIELILNKEYNTEFRHAETDKGEFKIYDKEMQRFYYADAYCPILNLWIEFDEPVKFKNGKLPEEHHIRENRIKSLIENVVLKRIYFDRKQFKNIKGK